MAEDRTLAIAIEAKLNRLDKNMAEAVKKVTAAGQKMEAASARAAAKMDKAFSGAFSGVTSRLNNLRNAFVGIVSVTALRNLIKGSLETAAAIKDVANEANISTKALQELRYAAAQNGASSEIMDSALSKLNKNLGDFRNTGAGPAKDALVQLGLAGDVMAGKFATSDDAMIAIVNRMQTIPGAADRASLATDLFGKSAGPKLAEFMAVGEVGIAAARAEAERFGLVLTDEMIRNADEADDTLNRVWETLKVAGVAAVAANADAIKQWALDVAESIPSILAQFKELLAVFGLMKRSGAEQLSAELQDWERLLDTAKQNQIGTFAVNLSAGPVASGLYQMEEIERAIARLKKLRGDAGAGGADYAGGYTLPSRVGDLLPPKPKPSSPPPQGAGRGDVGAAAKTLKDAATEAERAAKETERLAKAAKSVGIKLFGDNAEKQMDQLRIATDAAEELAQKAADFKESFRQDFRNVVGDLMRGDLQGAAQSLGDAFAGRAIDKLSDMAFDALWDAGFGDTMTSLFGDADLAQAEVAVQAQAAASGLAQLTAATLRQVAAMGGSGGGNTGDWLSKAVGIVAGIAGGSSGGGGRGWASGGPANAGEWGMVGEQGPELVKWGKAATVVPAMQTAKIMRGGGQPVVLNVSINNPTRDSLPFLEKQFAALQANLPRMIQNVTNNGLGRSLITPRR